MTKKTKEQKIQELEAELAELKNGQAPKDARLVEYEKWENHAYCMEAVKQDGYALQYVKEQTADVCMEAVKQDGDALRYVKEQTADVCLEAVKQDGYALQYVKVKATFLKIIQGK